tara:strand:+ start:62 stop:625 length:564 start_codon:yes stop_codon:yes gene_type:complete
MRIISGSLKGKKINFLKSSVTRPLKDTVKESIFNIISHSNMFDLDLQRSNILDLYSGVGSFGLECISRGANKVIFVEKDKNASKVIYQNLLTLNIMNKALVVKEEITNFLNKKNLGKFNIFFLDPPYINTNYLNDLVLIKQKKIYKKQHIVIIHRDRKSSDAYEKTLETILIRKYGRSKIIFAKFLR